MHVLRVRCESRLYRLCAPLLVTRTACRHTRARLAHDSRKNCFYCLRGDRAFIIGIALTATQWLYAAQTAHFRRAVCDLVLCNVSARLCRIKACDGAECPYGVCLDARMVLQWTAAAPANASVQVQREIDKTYRVQAATANLSQSPNCSVLALNRRGESRVRCYYDARRVGATLRLKPLRVSGACIATLAVFSIMALLTGVVACACAAHRTARCDTGPRNGSPARLAHLGAINL